MIKEKENNTIGDQGSLFRLPDTYCQYSQDAQDAQDGGWRINKASGDGYIVEDG